MPLTIYSERYLQALKESIKLYEKRNDLLKRRNALLDNQDIQNREEKLVVIEDLLTSVNASIDEINLKYKSNIL